MPQLPLLQTSSSCPDLIIRLSMLCIVSPFLVTWWGQLNVKFGSNIFCTPRDRNILLGVPYAKKKYSKNQVRNAGRALIGKRVMTQNEMFDIVNNWRFAHRYPLFRAKQLLARRAKKVDPSAIVVDRIKRLPSIETKLQLHPTMPLSNMQDIAGCRAIVSKSKMLPPY